MKQKLGSMYNLVSLTGVILSVGAAGLMIAFLAMEEIVGSSNPYAGLVYFTFPVMFAMGLLLVLAGALRTRRRRHQRGREEPSLPAIDFNDPHHRLKFFFFSTAIMVFLLIISITAIKGYEYTESTAFCGKLCHTVMTPEYTAWENSPHARVKCAECHIGSGAKWFVKTKLTGMKQLWAVLVHNYPTPIETPVANLRPARETCEECHWPGKFYSERNKVFYHFASDEKNSPREIDMVLKTGGAPKAPNTTGIHWHIGSEVYYQARDNARQDIAYIRVKGKDGRITEYTDTDKPLAKNEISGAKQRLMDCIDCHNRPTHIFRSPSQEIDENFVSGRIDPSLPYLKKTAVELLSKPYKTKAEAFKSIENGITGYYLKNYPSISLAKSAAIKNAVKEVRDIYSRNFFPEMKTAWNTHPDNIGHFYSPGCFRCHDGKHKSSDGRVISKDCNLCHTVTGQKQENIPAGANTANFVHPVDIGDELTKTNCSECHTAEGK
ncbi:MAG TPA: NapC/NirT family cytochrome c [Geobacteraceae bacterium]|nr:NapC/NirT family cytochrome c [Geobacteraceae bacterium]